MTQEQKDLLLKDLCARLPYGVKFRFKYIDGLFREKYGTSVLNGVCLPYRIIHSTLTGEEYLQIEKNEIKPYLFPLSSMTEEQKKEFLSAAGYEIREEDCGRHTETYYYDLVGHERDLYPNTEAIDWCRKNHFDIYGLIPMDLAIDATNKNIY